MPFVLVGDEAFDLKSYLMKPYPSRLLGDYDRIYNYRLSIARRVSEKAFEILTNLFRVFDKHMHLSPDKCTVVITNACVALHNFLLTRNDAQYCNKHPSDNEGVTLSRLAQQGSNHSPSNARDIREEYSDYFNTSGAVEWQWKIPFKTVSDMCHKNVTNGIFMLRRVTLHNSYLFITVIILNRL